MTDYPEALGMEAALRIPAAKGLADYLKGLAKGQPMLTLDQETAQFGKAFNDPIYGTFQVHPLLVMIIDTPEFQRLRGIKALGCTNFVYPGATHTRFEHCIGVSHLAGKLVDALASRQPELNISRSERLCVRIAGLLHDLGHGPFSHMWEHFVNDHRQPGDEHWEHEDMSLRIFEHLVTANGLLPAFKSFGLQEEDVKAIGQLIKGWKDGESNGHNPADAARPSIKRFLYEIVANKRNGVDVDKWDYLARDIHQCGTGNRFEAQRLIEFARVIEGPDKHLQICFRDNEGRNLYAMYGIRFDMHKRVYQHRVVRMFDAMICDALAAADPFLSVTGKGGKKYRPSEAHKDVKAYLKLTDCILENIYNDDRPELKPAQDIIHRIKTRQLYPLLGRTQPEAVFKHTEKEIIAELISTLGLFPDIPATDALLEENIVIVKICCNYGKKNDNPMHCVSFFRKDSPDEAMTISESEYSNVLPKNFQDCEVLICYRSENQAEVNAAGDVVTKWGERSVYSLSKCSVAMTTAKPTKQGRPLDDTDEKPHSDQQAAARKQMKFVS